MIATAVYVLCAATALACAVLLGRSYVKTRLPLLFWSALSFVGLGIANVLLVVDLVIVTGVDLSLIRSLFTLSGLAILLYSLIWESSQ